VTRIRASCPTCGEVELQPDDVALCLVRDRDGEVTDASSYRFDCPGCCEEVVKPADERIAELLLRGGVEVEERDELSDPVDQRPAHPESPAPGPALTYDDLLDLHLELTDDAWFERLLFSV
jgi:hypothetical protein